MNTRETLKKLHKKFPMMNLDELFEILDCYVEEYNLVCEPIKVWYSGYKLDTMPLKTNGIEFNKNSISCSTSNKMDYDGNTTTTANIDSLQFTASH